MKRIRLAIVWLTTVVALTVGIPSAHAATLVVDDDGRAEPGNCGAFTPTFSSIQTAVTAASPNDAIKVCPGRYNENLVVDKTLILSGAKAGQDARTRAHTGESIIHGTSATGAVQLLANRAVFNGFTVEDNANGPGVYSSPAFSGYRILNNVVQNNVSGIFLHNEGSAQALVRQNLIRNNNAPANDTGSGILSYQGASAIVIEANRFVHNLSAGVFFTVGGPVPNRNIVVKSNRSIDEHHFVAFYGVRNSVIRDNSTTDTTNADDWQQSVAIVVGLDSDGILIDSNVIRNAAHSGILVTDEATNVDVLGNSVTNAEAYGLFVASTTYAAVQAYENVFRLNDFSGIYMNPFTRGNVIQANSALENSRFDCEDGSEGSGTGGTGNFWNNNVGLTDDPPQLCRPPS
jgi:hypothetical protein